MLSLSAVGDYVIMQSAGAAIVPGSTDIGNHFYQQLTTIQLPFAYSLYGQAFSNVTVSSDGDIQFSSAYGGTPDYGSCLPQTYGFTNTIFAYGTFMRTDASGSGIFTSTSGSAPNRVFNIEWRATYYDYLTNGAPVNFEVRLYEGRQRFDVIYGTLNGTGTNAVVGVQNTVTKYTQFECNSSALSAGLQLTFEIPCNGGGQCLPLILPPTLSGTNFTFSFVTVSGKTNLVQYKNLLSDPIWQTLQLVAGDGAMKTVTNSPSAASQRFYRLLVQ